MKFNKPIYTKENGSIIPNISKWLIEKQNERKEEKRIIKKVTGGTLKSQELKYLIHGLKILRLMYHQGMDFIEMDLINSQKEITTKEGIIKALLLFTRRNVDSFLYSINNQLNDKYYTDQSQIDFKKSLEVLSKSNGIVTTKYTSKEVVDGKETEVVKERILSQKEIYDIIEDFQEYIHKKEINDLENIVNIGISIATFLGTATDSIRQSEKPIMTGSILTGGIAGGIANFIYKQQLREKEEDKIRQKRREAWFYQKEMIETEPIGIEDKKYMKKKTEESVNDYLISREIRDKKLNNADIGLDIIISIMLGALTINQTLQKGTFKVNMLPTILAQFGANTRVLSKLYFAMREIKDIQSENADYQEKLKQVQDIVKQIEEKEECLKEAENDFNTIEIKDTILNFYQKEEKEREQYGKTLQIQGFRANKGEMILLTGNSGNGKSTLLNLLKNGDVHNPKTIQIDKKEKVDKLGKQAIMFSSRTKLSDMTSILGQITRKERIEELTLEERKKLIEILQDLELYRPEKNIKDIISKKYSEFSSGQKNRISLAKVLYMLDDSKQVILLDEPTNFVERELRRKTFKAIKKYCMQGKPKTIIVATHDIEVAEEFADRRYHINQEGKVQEVPIKRKIQEERC